jgi:hypothetical protein
MADIGMKEIRDFFGMSSADLLTEWKTLSEEDKRQIKSGLADGTFNY